MTLARTENAGCSEDPAANTCRSRGRRKGACLQLQLQLPPVISNKHTGETGQCIVSLYRLPAYNGECLVCRKGTWAVCY